MGGGGQENNSDAHDFSHIDIIHEISIIFAVLLGLFIVSHLFEYVVNQSTKWIKDNVVASQIRIHLKSELVMLGFVSFVLFFTTYGINLNSRLNAEQTEHLVLLFEFVHMSIFITTILFMILVIYLAKFVGRRMQYWEQWETTDPNEVQRRFSNAKKSRCNGFPFRYWITERDKMGHYFQTIRTAFMHHLTDLPEEAFAPNELVFSGYLRHCMGIVMIFVVDIGWRVWLTFCGMVLALVIFKEAYFNTHGYFPNEHKNDEFFYGIYATSYIFMYVCWLLKRKTYRICKTIHKRIQKGHRLELGSNDGTQRPQEGSWVRRICAAWCKDSLCRGKRHDPVIDAFPFSSPDLIIRFYQLNMLFQASQLCLFLLVFVHTPVHVALKVTYVVPIIYFVLFYAPTALTYFTTCRFLGPLALKPAVEKIMRKYEVADDSSSLSSLSDIYVRKHSSMNEIARQVGVKSPRFHSSQSGSSTPGGGDLTVVVTEIERSHSDIVVSTAERRRDKIGRRSARKNPSRQILKSRRPSHLKVSDKHSGSSGMKTHTENDEEKVVADVVEMEENRREFKLKPPDERGAHTRASSDGIIIHVTSDDALQPTRSFMESLSTGAELTPTPEHRIHTMVDELEVKSCVENQAYEALSNECG